MSWRMSLLASAVKPASPSMAAISATRAEWPPAGSPMISRSPKPCSTRPGSGLAQVRCTTQPITRSSGNSSAMRPPGSTLASVRSVNGKPAGAACRNHHGTPFIAGIRVVRGPISGCIARAAAASAGPLSAAITKSCGPSVEASSVVVICTRVSRPPATSRSPCSRTAASVAPRASAATGWPAVASLAANKPPTAPRPTTAIFIVDAPARTPFEELTRDGSDPVRRRDLQGKPAETRR